MPQSATLRPIRAVLLTSAIASLWALSTAIAQPIESAPVPDLAPFEWRTPQTTAATLEQRAAAEAALASIAAIPQGGGFTETSLQMRSGFQSITRFGRVEFSPSSCAGPISGALNAAQTLERTGQVDLALQALDLIEVRLEGQNLEYCSFYMAKKTHRLRVEWGEWPPSLPTYRRLDRYTFAEELDVSAEQLVRLATAEAAITRNDLPKARELLALERKNGPATDDADWWPIELSIARQLVDMGRPQMAAEVAISAAGPFECSAAARNIVLFLFDGLIVTGNGPNAARLISWVDDLCLQIIASRTWAPMPTRAQSTDQLARALQQRFDRTLADAQARQPEAAEVNGFDEAAVAFDMPDGDDRRADVLADIIGLMAQLGYLDQALTAKNRLMEANNATPSISIPSQLVIEVYVAATSQDRPDIAEILRAEAERKLAGDRNSDNWVKVSRALVKAAPPNTPIMLPRMSAELDQSEVALAYAELAATLDRKELSSHPELVSTLEATTRHARVARSLRGSDSAQITLIKHFSLAVARYVVGDLASSIAMSTRMDDPTAAVALYFSTMQAIDVEDEAAVRAFGDAAFARARRTLPGDPDDRRRLPYNGGFCASIALATALPNSEWAIDLLINPVIERDPLADVCRREAVSTLVKQDQTDQAQRVATVIKDPGIRAHALVMLTGPIRVMENDAWWDAARQRNEVPTTPPTTPITTP